MLKGVGVAGLALTGAGAAAAGDDGVVSQSAAASVAGAKVDAVAGWSKFSSWEGASLGEPATFEARNAEVGPAYVPAAHVFPVRNGGEDVGYVTAAARDDWAPVLEYSTATPPTRLLDGAREAARAAGSAPTGRLLYHGGVQYGVETEDGQAINVRNGRPQPVGEGIEPSSMAFDTETVAAQRDALAGDGAAGSEVARPTATWDSLWDVPAWTEHDDGGADSTLDGPGDDAWDDWDGCVPVAASMVVAYHEGYDEDATWTREWYIDELHKDMNTNDAGSTFPTDIDDGFDSFSEGSNSYDGTNIYYWSHPDFTKSEITDNGRPFLLNMTSGGSAEDRDQNYGDHTTTVVGYASDGEELELHDTWDDSYHYLAWGSWTACSYTKVVQT